MNCSRMILGVALGFLLAAPVGAQTSAISELTITLQVAKLVQTLLATVAVLVAGGWAYFRFVRFRTLKPRVEFGFNWKTDAADRSQLLQQGSRLLGILTVKLTNRGNTQIELRKDDKYHCTLGVGLIAPPQSTTRTVYANCRNSDLQPLPFLFKAHKLIEPGETIDDVAVIFVDIGDAVAIQFNAQVLTVGHRGRREALMSSTIAFPIAPGKSGTSASNEDEQDDYNEHDEARASLFGWIGEANAFLARNPSVDVASKIKGTLEEASSLLPLLVDDASEETIERARTCAKKLKCLVKPHMK